MRLVTQALTAAAVVGLAAGTGSAYTAANTATPTTAVGQASTSTTGFAVSLVDYTMSAASATGNEITSVAFTLTAADAARVATEARVRLSTTGTYFACTPGTPSGAARPFTCAVTGVTAAAADVLDVAAVSH